MENANSQNLIDNTESQILQYISEHPQAADTVDGICAWWLGGQETPIIIIEKALERLVRKGKIEKLISKEGTALYRIIVTS